MFKKIYKWLDNYWYHYKWVTLVVIFFAVTLSIIIGQMITKTTPDSYILYGGPGVLTANQTKELQDAFASVLPNDFNGDESKDIEIVSIALMTDEQLEEAKANANENDSMLLYSGKALNDNKTSFATQLMSGEYTIVLIDEAQYENAYETGCFVKLEELFGENIPDCAYDDSALVFSETSFAEFFTITDALPDDTLLCVRSMSITSAFKGKEKAERQYSEQLSFYKAIVNFSMPQGYEGGE